ncbi:Succinate semialdehyde dehydrogenase [NAD(P)+] Sad [Leucobacter aridicollis]|uniref:Succinate-semialdehyde dehydrogenase/glutarate-semialdehyde dehydrogenase n=1 Tax=Leucobacter aridicollis TaxID=283878 RepID=A0A852QY89_9MICO|nr:NAD-dependent succinate-semialdehyde dehydrogenase [Leucobacter aridicollis]MBL3682873.1 NAD-dependent succinate-semialdehyde dehydrogenase [Leucobacter aridicollis]MCS3427014.1 succinate-semialdehyde dehydrogenase/glutarate-semialdehyde dehydrogenase [Leucobacter aridicollis]NYD26311.1 succinate-semialdehyde dehydrogenase/glutarate-semialdehyde dehydrogenase [Leucobacter aridicollis]RKQ85275.1 succinate-semialdehyde dehydrogenase/glutarate-semialdehyde dehydrogenase [Mycolicibacterium mucog
MGTFAVINPATGEKLAEYPDATAADIEAALASTQQTYQEWSRKTTVAERAALAKRAAELFDERKEELGAIINREMGKPLDQSIGEAEFSGAITAAFADNAEKWLADEHLEVEDGLKTFFRFQGTGVILGIMPWNYPYYQVARFAVPNLILGNTIILKHAAQCPESALALEQLFLDAGFPKGAYVNVFATHEQVSDIIADDRVQGVSLTGSERAGAIVAEQAGRALKKCVLELGGSDVFLVLDSANLDHAVEHAVGGRMENTGQACNGSKRIVVMDKYFDEFSEKFQAAIAGQSYSDGDFGPMSSEAATKTLAAQVQGAIDQGAEVVVGNNEPEGNVYTPSIITNITPKMDVYSQELFGPVAQLYKVSSDEEAIQLANSSPYGLGSVIICDDLDRAEQVGNQLDVGMVFIGGAGLEGADVPFGGVKKSGYGRELGKVGMLEFANKKLFRYAG